MKNNGGFLLLKFDKNFSDLSSTDFDKSIFKDLARNPKPAIIRAGVNEYVFDIYVNPNVIQLFRHFISCDDSLNITEFERISIQYAFSTDELTYEYNYYES